MPTMTLTALNVYPIKSAGGIGTSTWPVDAFGLQYDRRWMLVDESGEAITQRDCPRLALVRPAIVGGRLQVTAPGKAPFDLPLAPEGAVTTMVTVWDDTCAAWWMGERAARWFTEALGVQCSLVYMPDSTLRPADPTYAPPDVRVSFADGFPFLLISESSLADLNRRLDVPLPMNRFRPNLVIAGGPAFVEDELGAFRIGGLDLEVVKPCARCVLTTTDQDNATRGPEPLRTLATFRKVGSKVLFGQNVVHRGTGRLTVGDAVEV